MPWREVSVMDERREFVRLAMQEGVNRREPCRRFGISPDIGYKWLARWQAGDRELVDRSRRPTACHSGTQRDSTGRAIGATTARALTLRMVAVAALILVSSLDTVPPREARRRPVRRDGLDQPASGIFG
jgi:transposase-like protein